MVATTARIRTPLTDLVGIEHPIVQTGMGWVAGPRLVSATAEAGALGILASATMSLEELERAIIEVKSRTRNPFGVNLRADASDAGERARLLIDHGVRLASFALAPKKDLISRLKDHGIVVMPSIGAARHAEKVAAWGADLVMIQGGEGGGHTGAVPTTLLLPSVLDAVDIPVVAGGGFYDGRGLAAALAYGAAGVGMGTRFLLTSDSAVPQSIKEQYLTFGLDGTVVTRKADGMPHRLLRTHYVNDLESERLVHRVVGTAKRTIEFKKMSNTSWSSLLLDGRRMKNASDRTWSQMTQAANTPMLLKAGLVDGDTSAGMLASGQVVGLIDSLPSCDEVVTSIVDEANRRLNRASSLVAPDRT
ncbi:MULTISPECIES: NAD(P)H-dependent flavin oxidoreductase [Nocardiaceae]|uniref:NAD(P)H-dependent flavin oxidoreductase n=1 Tax=Nocardiaceae TaxID=85025 RepID=UPI00286D1937|nr:MULTISPECIES: nitronate monooxygenase [Rhodococcus]